LKLNGETFPTHIAKHVDIKCENKCFKYLTIHIKYYFDIDIFHITLPKTLLHNKCTDELYL